MKDKPSNKSSNFTIGTVAERTGLAASAIRYYETVGIVPRPYRISGRRVYDERWMKWLGIAMLAQDAGFTIEEIRNLVTPFQNDSRSCEVVQKVTTQKVKELDEKIKRIKKMKMLLNVIATNDCNTIEDCGASALKLLYDT